MKGYTKSIALFPDLIASEWQAVVQYSSQAECARNAGYERLAKWLDHQAADEGEHAKLLLARLNLLRGNPGVTTPGTAPIKGFDAEAFLTFDYKSEEEAIGNYRNAVKVAWESEDYVSARLFQSNMSDEEGHRDEIATYQGQIEAIGLEMFLLRSIE